MKTNKAIERNMTHMTTYTSTIMYLALEEHLFCCRHHTMYVLQENKLRKLNTYLKTFKIQPSFQVRGIYDLYILSFQYLTNLKQHIWELLYKRCRLSMVVFEDEATKRIKYERI